MSSWRFKSTYTGKKDVAPDIVVAELQRLEQEGAITATRVVEAARPLEAPLHPEFEWDDAIAGEAYRMGQARALIRSVEVLVPARGPEQPREVQPAYVHVPHRNPFKEGTYVTPAVLVAHVDQYERALSESLRFLASSERNFHFLRSLGENLPESVQAIQSQAHEAFHLLRQCLETLRIVHNIPEEAAD